MSNSHAINYSDFEPEKPYAMAQDQPSCSLHAAFMKVDGKDGHHSPLQDSSLPANESDDSNESDDTNESDESNLSDSLECEVAVEVEAVTRAGRCPQRR